MRNLLRRKNKQGDSLSLQDMPDEIVLKILSYLEIKNILKMCQTSKRYHEICQEDSLWQIFDFSGSYAERSVAPQNNISFVISTGDLKPIMKLQM